MVKMVKTLFLEADYDSDVELSGEFIDYLNGKNYHKIALYASVQFVKSLGKVKKQLEKEDIMVLTSKPDRTHTEGQLLGCNVYGLNLDEEVDCYLYLGDGKFHPLALIYSQEGREEKEVICYNPYENKKAVLSQKDVEKIIKRKKGAVVKFLSSENVGVIVTIKPGQEHYKPALALKKRFHDKNFYYFIDNDISFNQLENFPFVEVWVNTACPRIALDDVERFSSVINLQDVLSL